MNAEIIAVGSEMLGASRLDTNSLFLTEQLNNLGIEVVAKHVVGDECERLAAMIRTAMSSSELVIVTGGLGPTGDDLTREAASAALGVELVSDENVLAGIEARFARRGRRMTENNRNQAMLLAGAQVLVNPHGTAPGQWFACDGRYLALLPGPPGELRPMATGPLFERLETVVPHLAIATRFFRIARMPESELDAAIAPIYAKYQNPVTTILAKPGEIEVHLRARAATAGEAERLCSELAAPILEALGTRIYSTNGDPLETVVGHLLRDRGETVAVAESCTGGMLGARFTDTPGSSGWFRGGYIVYHTDLKKKLIGDFDADPVSEEVALRLAEGAREQAGAAWGVSVTGYAGPEGRDPGALWIGIVGPDGRKAQSFRLFAERMRDRLFAAQIALDLLRLRLLRAN